MAVSRYLKAAGSNAAKYSGDPSLGEARSAAQNSGGGR
jgi:hypothetical protein